MKIIIARAGRGAHQHGDDLHVLCGTWNQGDQKPEHFLKCPSELRHWLGAGPSPDVVVVGLQECADVNGWHDAIHAYLNAERLPKADGNGGNAKAAGGDAYATLEMVTLKMAVVGGGGIHILCFVLASRARHISHVQTCTVAEGAMGIMGNKGAAALSFHYREKTRFAFCTSHFAARVTRVRQRAQNYRDTVRRAARSSSSSSSPSLFFYFSLPLPLSLICALYIDFFKSPRTSFFWFA